jgi:hypothetical protein
MAKKAIEIATNAMSFMGGLPAGEPRPALRGKGV